MPTVKSRQAETKTFYIDYLSPQDDVRYTGTFTTKRLSVRDRAQLGVRKAVLNGNMHYDPERPGFGVDAETSAVNNMIAHLELSITTAPDWWDLDSIADTNLLVVVFKEVLSFENSFLRRESNRAQSGQSSEASGQANTQETNVNRTVSAVVGKEVQSALEP